MHTFARNPSFVATSRVALFTVVAVLSLSIVSADEKEDAIEKSLLKAKQRLNDTTYELMYKFKEGETIRSKVTHLVTIETQISDTRETAKTQSVSTRVWTIREVDTDGNIRLVHSVENVDMWQQLSDRDEIRYNSEKDDVPPLVYKKIAETLGKPLATITINKYGQIVERQNATEQFNPSTGELTVPLPRQPIKVGQSWHLTDSIRVPLETQQFKTIKIRLQYKLDSVKDGIAKITMDTKVLTPVRDPKIESKLVQKMKSGYIMFDIEKGRVINSRLDLDKTVVNFSGANSIMQYLARFTEESLPAAEKKTPRTANAKQPEKKTETK